jgi:hypothetical protein
MDSIAGGALRTRLFGIFLALIVFAFAGTNLCAQVKLLHIDPQQTDPAIEAVHGPHIAMYDAQAPSAHRLFVFFVGTGGKAQTSLGIDSAFAAWGYHAIGLDYEDKVAAASCTHSQDAACFDHYREAIVTGAPGSDMIRVDPANSILNRLQKLLVYLVNHDPGGEWGEFVEHGQPVWSRIVVAGHSQGSGHAAYIGKMFNVDEVLMFSGPQDYLDDLDKPAAWQARPSATPPSRYFAFLNENDPFNVHHQIANCMVLMGLADAKPRMVKPAEAIEGNYQIFVNDETEGAHGSTILPQFENVWKYFGVAGEGDSALRPSSPPPLQPSLPQ